MRIKTLIIAASAALATTAAAGDRELAKIERGAYLAQIMDCGGCHTPRGPDGAPVQGAGLSGGNVGFEIPGLGVFWPPNLTPHETGLGGWSRQEVAAAVRAGVRPDGRMLSPAMPWPAYATLSDEDVDALVAFLFSLAPAASERLDPISDSRVAVSPFYRMVAPEVTVGSKPPQ